MNKLELNKDEFLLKNVFVFGLSFLTFLGCLALYLSESINSYIIENITESNIIPYALLIIIFMIAVIIFNLILSHLKLVQYLNRCNPIVANIIAFTLFGINVFGLGYIYLTEMDTYDAPGASRLLYHTNEYVTFVLIVGIFFAVAYFIESYKDTLFSGKENKVLFYLFVITIAVIYGYTMYTPNCFSTFANMHHGNAYFNSVYHAMLGEPRSHVNTGVYGYYSFLISPFVKFLGGTLTSFYIVIGILCAISLLCMAFAINIMVKSPMIKVVGMLAMTIASMTIQWGIYPQLYPHRTLFPSIMLAYMVLVYKKNGTRKGWMIGGYILAATAIVWNVETGAACLLAWMAFQVYDKLVKYSLLQIRLYIHILIQFAFSFISFGVALLYVNVVNFLLGGATIPLKDFLFPLLTSDYMEGFLIIAIPKTFTAWVVVVGLFCVLLAHCIVNTKLSPVRTQYSLRNNLFFGVSVLGIGQITYYINRAAYGNLMIIQYVAIFIICIIADWSLQKYTSKTENQSALVKSICRSITYMTTTLLLLVFLGGVCNYYAIEVYRAGYSYRNMETVEAFIDTVEESIPKDTRAIGSGVAEIYSFLHWDCYYDMIDFSDLAVLPDAAYYMNEELSKLDMPIFVNDASLAELDSYSVDGNKEFYEKFEVVQTFQVYDDLKYSYYVPKNN